MQDINKNILYMGAIQGLKFALPLITFPYLTRVLGVEGFGYISFAAAIITYGMIFSQFGFNYTATSRVSRIREYKYKLSLYCSSVIYAKLILFILSLFIISIFLILKKDTILTLVAFSMFPMLLGSLIVPIWFFQGIEKMKHLALYTFIGRLITIPFIFLFVNDRGDLYLAAFLQGMPFLITGVISSYYMFKTIPLRKVNLNYIWLTIRSSTDVFLTNLASSMYLSLLSIIIGFVSSVENVGYFNIAQTIKNICTQCLNPIFQTIYPRISYLVYNDKNLARVTLRKYVTISFSLSIMGCAFVYLLDEEIIKLIAGSEYLNAKLTVDIILLAIIFGVLNNFFGVQTLIPMGKNKAFRNIVSSAAFLCILISYPVIKFFGHVGAAYLLVSIEVIIFLGLYFYHKKNKLNLLI